MTADAVDGAATGMVSPAPGDAPPGPGRPLLQRRRLLLGAAAGAGVAAVGTGGGAVLYRRRHAVLPLLSETVARTGPSAVAGTATAGTGTAAGTETAAGTGTVTGTVTGRTLVAVGAAGRVVPGTRVLRDATDVAALVAADRAWLAAGVPWTTAPGPWTGLGRDALLDLRVLLLPGGAAVAGWTPGWRYVWPRDAAHVTAALAVSGHTAEALAVLGFLQRAQRADGGFEARYTPGGEVAPGGRPPQLDGTGWVLWAAAQLAGALALTDAIAALDTVRPLLLRATGHALDAIDTPDSLPAPSPDYWETPETTTTLGTAAPLLAGLTGIAGPLVLLGETGLGREAAAGGQRLAAAITTGFGAAGYPRHLHGGDRDAAVAFLFPPYVLGGVVPGLRTALAESAGALRRPGGGLAPGSAWREDGISWTPETALFALASAASGDVATAHERLRWLRAHRTRAGSLPEKVLYDGRPASVAPLGWTAALVVLTLNALQTVTGQGLDDLH